MTTVLLKEEPDLGYIFFPATHENALGFPRFDVVIHTHPTNRHYDPITVSLWVQSPTAVERTTIHHPWLDGYRRKVLPGRIIVRDRRGKEVEAFTFGANLEISSKKEQTICVFTAPVPILHLISTHSAAIYFADEVEGFLARYKARLGVAYVERIAAVDPTTFYYACLNAIQEKLTHLPAARTAARQHFEEWVPQEIERMRMDGERPSVIETLDDMLLAQA